MMHPTRVHGIVTVNNTATESLGRFTDRLKVHRDNNFEKSNFFSYSGQTKRFETRPKRGTKWKATPTYHDRLQPI